MSGWMSAELHYWGCKVGLLGYCLPCDHYGWSWPHRRHARCWRGSADGRAWQKRLQGLVSKRAEGDE